MSGSEGGGIEPNRCFLPLYLLSNYAVGAARRSGRRCEGPRQVAVTVGGLTRPEGSAQASAGSLRITGNKTPALPLEQQRNIAAFEMSLFPAQSNFGNSHRTISKGRCKPSKDPTQPRGGEKDWTLLCALSITRGVGVSFFLRSRSLHTNALLAASGTGRRFSGAFWTRRVCWSHGA
jgi:hypothetical protein